MLTTEFIDRVLTTIPNRTVGLLGDLFLDRYLDIDPARDEPSVETGLTAYQVVNVRSYPGALGTVLNNLAALGVGRIYPIAAIGDDGEGYELRQALKATAGVALDGVFSAPGRRTPTYTKPMVIEGGKPTRELNRLDIKNRTPTPQATESTILERLEGAWPQLDALIVLDQVSETDCGVVTKRVRERLAELGDRDPAKFVLADSREQIALFRSVCVKPNEREVRQAVGGDPAGMAPLNDYGSLNRLTNHAWNRTVFATRGEFGIDVIDLTGPSRPSYRMVPGYPASGPIDIVGAGDSCSAGITCAMVSGATHEQAAAFGNLVASITVQQIGVTGTASPEQVRHRWREVAAS